MSETDRLKLFLFGLLSLNLGIFAWHHNGIVVMGLAIMALSGLSPKEKR